MKQNKNENSSPDQEKAQRGGIEAQRALRRKIYSFCLREKRKYLLSALCASILLFCANEIILSLARFLLTSLAKGVAMDTQEHLIALMHKEVSLMREVLSNMHQEEVCLRLNDQFSIAKILAERSQIISALSPVRQERVDACKAIGNQLSDNCEILSMRDQLMTLMEKINSQNIINERLCHTIHLSPQIQEEPKKKKLFIGTIE